MQFNVVAALIFSLAAGLAQAATVNVTQTETGMMRLTNCPDFVCLDTGQGQETEQDSWQAYTLSAQITFDEQDAVYSYSSRPFPGTDYDLGNRQFSYTGHSAIVLTLNGREFLFSGPVSMFVGEIWPAYTHRIYMTGGISWDLPTPIGQFRFSHYGERSIPYVITPQPHVLAPEMDLPFRPVQIPNSYVAGSSYFLTLWPSMFDLRVERDEPAAVPLPTSGLLLAIGAGSLLLVRRRRRLALP